MRGGHHTANLHVYTLWRSPINISRASTRHEFVISVIIIASCRFVSCFEACVDSRQRSSGSSALVADLLLVCPTLLPMLLPVLVLRSRKNFDLRRFSCHYNVSIKILLAVALSVDKPRFIFIRPLRWNRSKGDLSPQRPGYQIRC